MTGIHYTLFTSPLLALQPQQQFSSVAGLLHPFAIIFNRLTEGGAVA